MATTVALAFVLAVVLGYLVSVLPLRGNDAHAASHLAVAVPAGLLLALARRTWPPPAVRAEVLSRGVFLLGLGLVGGGMVLEAIGAYGYEEDGGRRIEELTTLHSVAVPFGGMGLLLTVLGGILIAGVQLAASRGRVQPRYLTGVVVVVLVAVAVYFGGVFFFGF
ncbi:MAG: hypothetical protein ACLGI3_08560 [Actinomycetes bacterium]